MSGIRYEVLNGNMKHKIVLSIMLSLIMIMFIPAPSAVFACSCVEPQSVEAELVRSEAVFAGKVLEIKENKSLGGYMTKSVLLEVTQSWKGAQESQIIITTGQGGGDCGYDFQEGMAYLVYANSSSMYGDEDDLVTIICSRTTELSTAQADLAILGNGDEPQIQVSLEGELDGFNIYIWATGIIILGIIGFLSWRKYKTK